jgi:hypothetical protein
METQTGAEAGRRAWWSARRRRYNITLLVAAAVAGVMLLTLWALFEDRFPCLEVTAVILFFWGLLFLVGVSLANICYFLGPLSEWIIRPRNALAFRRLTYGAGVAFSLLLIFAPLILNLGAALFAQECTDKFGERHTVGAASAPIGSDRT